MSAVATSETKGNQSKKKGKNEDIANAVTAAQLAMDHNGHGDGENLNGADNQSPYVKELHRNIRNVSKKLAGLQRVEAIIAENPGISLDELVVSRKINTDQKAQVQKKPALQAQLTQLEDQIAQYKKFEGDYQQRLNAEKEALQAAHEAEVDKLRETMKAEAAVQVEKVARNRLLILSRFLRAAAARRQMDDESSDESRAFEGVLLLLYGGDDVAVTAAEKLIAGANEQVPSTEGISLSVTYDRIRQMSLEYAPFAAEEAWAKDVASADSSQALDPLSSGKPVDTDPTVAHAGLTEIEEQTKNINNLALNEPTGVEQSRVDLGAANSAAADHWDSAALAQSGESLTEEWVSVPRHPTETENGSATALHSSTENWADEPNEPLAEMAPASGSIGSDGFREVHHGRVKTRGSTWNEQRGGRGRGGYRGGERGERGRGGYRGDRGSGDSYSRGRGRGGRSGKPREVA